MCNHIGVSMGRVIALCNRKGGGDKTRVRLLIETEFYIDIGLTICWWCYDTSGNGIRLSAPIGGRCISALFRCFAFISSVPAAILDSWNNHLTSRCRGSGKTGGADLDWNGFPQRHWARYSDLWNGFFCKGLWLDSWPGGRREAAIACELVCLPCRTSTSMYWCLESRLAVPARPGARVLIDIDALNAIGCDMATCGMIS